MRGRGKGASEGEDEDDSEHCKRQSGLGELHKCRSDSVFDWLNIFVMILLS